MVASTVSSFDRRLPILLPAEWIAAPFSQAFGVDVTGKIRCYEHHSCHAWSAFGASGFTECLVVSLDGHGDGLGGMVSVATDGRLERLKGMRIEDQSLGHFYQDLSALLGYGSFDEYKVMGLAPYGDPSRYSDFFQQCYKLLGDGDYWIAPRAKRCELCFENGLVRESRRRGEPFEQHHKDIAASLQHVIESITMHLLSHYRQTTGQTRLCLTGGVAHNCSMNGMLLYSGLFDQIFVQPASHDAGIALGAAYQAARDLGEKKPFARSETLFLGRDIGDNDEIEAGLEPWAEHGIIEYSRLEDACVTGADLICKGEVIAWAQGRSEFGPRALGNRSILADPRPAENKSRINAMVKKREGYRPFAPSVLVERAGEFFELPQSQKEFPYMVFVLRVLEKWHAALGAITHVDGTARVQTVARKDNERYWRLLDEVGKRTGIPMVLNTSFNNNAEPIVDSVHDAITCFLTTGLDGLIVGDWLVRKTDPGVTACPGFLKMAAVLPDGSIVRKRALRVADGTVAQHLEVTRTPKSRSISPPDHSISRRVFNMLSIADGTQSIAELLERCRADGGGSTSQVLEELDTLWQARAIEIRPARGQG
jgi:carbamoyltransferase